MISFRKLMQPRHFEVQEEQTEYFQNLQIRPTKGLEIHLSINTRKSTQALNPKRYTCEVRLSLVRLNLNKSVHFQDLNETFPLF